MTEEFDNLDSPEVWAFTLSEDNKCPKCNSKNISKICHDCHAEWMEEGA